MKFNTNKVIFRTKPKEKFWVFFTIFATNKKELFKKKKTDPSFSGNQKKSVEAQKFTKKRTTAMVNIHNY